MGGVFPPGQELADPEPDAGIQETPSRQLNSPAAGGNDAGRSQSPERDVQVSGLRATKPRLTTVILGVLGTWLLTAILAGSIYAVLAVYSNKPVMSQGEKRGFNAFITGLSIALGLTIASSLDEMVGDLRWWILSRRHRSIHKASQLAVASIGLCYSTDAAQGQARLVPGNVSLPNMLNIETAKLVSSQSASFSAQQYTANSFGTISLAFVTASLDEIPARGQLWFSDDPLMFCGETHCRYVFHEMSTRSILDNDSSPVTVTTSRTVDVSAFCYGWPVTRGGDGAGEDITIDTDNGELVIPIPIARGVDETMYMTNTSRTCGPGCSIIYAFESSHTAPWFYQCNVTVGPVTNATRPEHEIGANLTSMASSAIALQGYDASSLVNSTDFQFQVYPAESVFGVPFNGTVDSMALLLARFTIGVVAVTAESNDQIVIRGMMPVVGIQLKLTHGTLIIMILVLVTGLQLVLGLGVAWLAHRVVVPQGGPTCFAKVFQSMTERDHPLANSPSNMNPAVAAKSKSKSKSKSEWIYRDTQIGDGIYDLHMEEKCKTETNNTNNGTVDNDLGQESAEGERGDIRSPGSGDKLNQH